MIYKGKSVAVLAMFSKKKLTYIDFEVLGIFCDQLSKELAGFLRQRTFYWIKILGFEKKQYIEILFVIKNELFIYLTGAKLRNFIKAIKYNKNNLYKNIK